MFGSLRIKISRIVVAYSLLEIPDVLLYRLIEVLKKAFSSSATNRIEGKYLESMLRGDPLRFTAFIRR